MNQQLIQDLEKQEKNWKFSPGDLKERAHWEKYQECYEEAISKTFQEQAPWFVIPADNKWFARVAAIQIIIEAMEKMDLKFPTLSEKQTALLEESKKELENE